MSIRGVIRTPASRVTVGSGATGASRMTVASGVTVGGHVAGPSHVSGASQVTGAGVVSLRRGGNPVHHQTRGRTGAGGAVAIPARAMSHPRLARGMGHVPRVGVVHGPRLAVMQTMLAGLDRR
jgi:hypothetical protein